MLESARRELLDRQVAEMEAIEAIFDGDESVEITTVNDSLANVKSFLSDGKGDLSRVPEIRLRIRFTATAKGAECKRASEVLVGLPAGYPETAAPDVTLDAEMLHRSGTSSLEERMAEMLSDAAGQECLFQAIQLIKDHMGEQSTGGASAVSIAGSQWRNAGGGESTDDASSSSSFVEGEEGEEAEVDLDALRIHFSRSFSDAGGKVTLGRRLCYSHHIIAPGKRQAVVNWALQLQLGGCSKIGWPGLIIVEGDEENCRLYIDGLQRLRWKQFVVRGEETVEGKPGQTIDDLRALPRGFCEFGTNEMSEFAQVCKDAGLEDLFLTSMKIYQRRGDTCADNRFDDDATASGKTKKAKGKKKKR